MSGVIATRTGYMGGSTNDPSYHSVCTKSTGHAEVVEVTYDPNQISTEQLLKGFFDFHDATQDRSGNGGQYRSVVFWRKLKEYDLLTSTIQALHNAGLPVSTSVEKAGQFWEAEERHQGYVVRSGRHHNLTSITNLADLTIEEIVRAKAS